MQQRRTTLTAQGFLVAANLLIPAAILIFAAGFFPYKPFLSGLAQYDDLGYGPPPPPPFNRLVFMVVDALRSDFVFAEGSGFEFTQGLIRDGYALPYTAHAASPTVTMPRLKAITTGSIPSFLDVILNLDEADSSSTLASQDTWLAQMRAKKAGKLVMYGDDTWLKLFPHTFDRADGTSSFFVSDFTEVDSNVTRHIDAELRQNDWNTMVLHYLGLDHIGHKSGPRSVNMVPKQREMDGIVRRIYKAMETYPHLESTILVLCGDHGMNDAGNHGASSAGETSPALVFMSPKLKSVSKPLAVPAPYREDFQYYSAVEQSDLAPTLGALLGFPVPKNNLGAIISDFLPMWPQRREQVHILMHNAKQIFRIVVAAFGDSMLIDSFDGNDCSHMPTDAEELACEWHFLSRGPPLDSSQALDDVEWDQRVLQWLRNSQRTMSSMASNYDITRLSQGAAVALLALMFALVASILSVRSTAGSILCFATVTILYGTMMFASSYVEEEQHFWYWSATAWLVYLSYKRSNMSMLGSASVQGIVLVSMRLIRGWNQTGQKFAGSPDLVKLFLLPHPRLLWCLILGAYAMVTTELMVSTSRLPNAINQPVILGLALSAISFKLAFTNEDAPELVVGCVRSLLHLIGDLSLVARAQAVFLGLSLALIYPLYLLTATKGSARYRGLKVLHGLYTLLALTQTRATNIPLFLLFRILQAYLEALSLSIVEITTSSIILQFASFFAMGGSNAISSVDLSSAYNGISDFNVVAVGVLTFISNWAAPIWWASATTLLLLRNKHNNAGNVFQSHIALLTLFVAASLTFVMAACTALRTHLFIWTVFSPKYLYSMGWSIGQHIAVNVGLGGLLYWLGSRAR
ncbi:alkaline-phosphatase-like protein [Truncatella angustata]|uniref:GPI ethanolamine phosphate transferase 2 n=1 Tax=Truncatella angustata TaxID=152316 RepID=A0A9P9A333_9PEZI|nr:alkaline-phosphatase-like protein [Truncatella angustata]KAH6661411.1 alkaline-phosphatase-like protein [Truncatella angustata]